MTNMSSPCLRQISIIIQQCRFNEKAEIIANVIVKNLDVPFFS